MKKLFYVLLLLVLCACQKVDDPEATQGWTLVKTTTPRILMTKGNTISEIDPVMTLGKKLQNPYSVSNMTVAYNNLSTRSTIPDFDIKATHLYIKFNPRDSVDFEKLKEDKTIDYYSYPLDYEILSEGIYEPVPDNGSIPCLWAAVTVDKTLPAGVPYEILDYLFIPEETVPIKGEGYLTQDIIDLLEDEALRLTDNEENEIVTKKRSKWAPSGTIMVYDDAVGRDLPLEGAIVRARRWFTTYRMRTNKDGYYLSSHTFKRRANYSIVWEGDKWDIRSGTFGQAIYNGPKIEGAWNLTINSGKSIRYAHIHRAAYRWFHQNTFGLTPPEYRRNIKIAYKDKNKDSNGDFWKNFTGGALPDIRIFRSNRGVNRTMYQIFATTLHELGHAAHASHISQYGKIDNVIVESWAKFVEWVLTIEDYKEWTAENPFTQTAVYYFMNRPFIFEYPDQFNLQGWTQGGGDYTPLFIDVHDNSDQRQLATLKDWTASRYVKDNICIAENDIIESIAYSSHTIGEVKVKLKALAGKTNIPFTTTDVDNLFEFY